MTSGRKANKGFIGDSSFTPALSENYQKRTRKSELIRRRRFPTAAKWATFTMFTLVVWPPSAARERNHAALQCWQGANFTAGRGSAWEGGRAPTLAMSAH